MKSILNIIGVIIAIIAGIATIFSIYLQSSENKPIIEIKTISSDKLTNLPNLDGLNANYTYKSKPVRSLWKLHYIISNIGNKTIIGEGNNKNIIKNNIKFSLGNNFKILELSNSDKNKHIKIKTNENLITFSFLQWKQNENINLIIYVEQLNNKGIPILITNDREIINGEVKYSSLLDEINNDELALFYKLPQLLQNILWWLSIIIFGFIVIILPFVWISSFLDYINFKKWKREHKETYNQFITKLIEENHLEEHLKPNDLPDELWEQYQFKVPKVPTDDLQEMTIGTIALIGISIIPLLLLIKI
jgi:hypothetical protein